ncbi:MAG: hypothetical protein P1P88_21795, partial [Bacteroidales bacterium]|nr:hypothetical protein [Bacteroidales bacterium]
MELANKKGITFLFISCLLLLLQINGLAQNSLLARKISINIENTKIEDALDLISKKGRFYFSYNSAIFEEEKIIPSLKENNVSVKSLIEKIFDDKIEAFETGKYIILKPAPKNKPEEKPTQKSIPEQKTRYTITGYIVNSQTGERLSNATIYEIGKTNSVLANMDGYYNITVSTKNDRLGLAYSRRNFKDTIIVIQPANHSINMRLRPKEELPETIDNKKLIASNKNADAIAQLEELSLVKFAVKRRQFDLSKNLEFLEKQHFQVSILPNIGTNKLMSGNVENNVSLNILAGYSYAVNGFEMGGFLNIVRTNVNGLQMAGFSNLVGGNTKGIQLAGFMNNNRQSVTGIQVAGFSNLVLDTITGVQLSGFSNVLKGRMNGLQLAGFSNVTTENVDGVQASGFLNYARKDVRFAQLAGFANYGVNVGGVQASGFANIGNDIGGAQLAGFVNYAHGKVGGAQIAGFLNIAEQVNSAQLAGFINVSRKEITGLQASTINIANKVKGFQFGFINYADSVSGISLGFLSFVLQGIHKFELSLNENLYTNLSFKTGTHRFYNIFTAAINIENNNYWTVGYGLGTEFRSKKRFYLDLDLTGSQVNENFDAFDYINLHFKFDTRFSWRLFKSSGISIGPSLNFFITDWKNTEG